MEQLSLFSLLLDTPAAPPTWAAAKVDLDREYSRWRSLHPSDLAGILRRTWGQDDLYSLYIEVMAERKASSNLVDKSNLRRYATALYVAMTGDMARRTFGDECRKAILAMTNLKLHL